MENKINNVYESPVLKESQVAVSGNKVLCQSGEGMLVNVSIQSLGEWQ